MARNWFLAFLLFFTTAFMSPTAFGKPMSKKLMFAYVDLSSFNENGDAVWLADEGDVFIQTAQPPTSKIFKFNLQSEQLTEIRETLKKSKSSELKTHDRIAIPGEITIRFGYRTTAGEWASFKVLDGDWSHQPTAIGQLHDIAQKLVAQTAHLKPSSMTTFKPGQLKVEIPSNLQKEDVDLVLSSPAKKDSPSISSINSAVDNLENKISKLDATLTVLKVDYDLPEGTDGVPASLKFYFQSKTAGEIEKPVLRAAKVHVVTKCIRMITFITLMKTVSR